MLTPFCLGIFVATLVFSFILTKLVRDAATVRGWVALPGVGRHLHSRALPRLGGVAIFGAFLLSFSIALIAARFFPSLNFGFSLRSSLAILAPGTLIFLLGVYDDVHPVGPYVKFAVQAIAAAMLYAGGLRVLELPVLFGSHQLSWFVDFPLTIVWVLAVTNAFNLIDGLDGLAAGSGLFSTLVVFVVALISHSQPVALMSLALAGAILGFLRFNFNPATIFLGDCGSLFIGFMLSALALYGAQKAPTTVAVAIPVVSFGLPILETALSIARRFISGRPVFTADREHIHHKLLQMGFSHRQVVIVLYGVSGIFALLSLFLLWPQGSTLGLVLAVIGTGVWIGVQHLGYLEFGELRRVAHRTMEQRQVFINNLSIRRALEEMKVAGSYNQFGHTLVAAFSSNDFDAFDLTLDSAPPELDDNTGLVRDRLNSARLRWVKPGSRFEHEMITAWSLRLDLVTANHRRIGTMNLHRLYSERDLQIDINLLIAVFPVAMADALHRIAYANPPAALIAPSRSVAAARAG